MFTICTYFKKNILNVFVSFCILRAKKSEKGVFSFQADFCFQKIQANFWLIVIILLRFLFFFCILFMIT